MNPQQILATVVPAAIAIIVVAGWVGATLLSIAVPAELRDAALAVIGFYFGFQVHAAGYIDGVAAASAPRQ